MKILSFIIKKLIYLLYRLLKSALYMFILNKFSKLGKVKKLLVYLFYKIFKKKMKLLIYIAVFVIFFAATAYPLNTKKIIAYPVPFYPAVHQNLKLGYETGVTPDTLDKVRIQIYDINEDLVLDRQYASLSNVLWNGRNDKGKPVKTGMYIIKITVENTATGDFGVKTIKIFLHR